MKETCSGLEDVRIWPGFTGICIVMVAVTAIGALGSDFGYEVGSNLQQGLSLFHLIPLVVSSCSLSSMLVNG